jgi:ribosome assembly protein YihI (activator of Der GTPase)
VLIADEIKALLAKADALRVLPEDAQEDLPAVVDRINALRAMEAAGLVTAQQEPEDAKRKPGRPRKSE